MTREQFAERLRALLARSLFFPEARSLARLLLAIAERREP